MQKRYFKILVTLQSDNLITVKNLAETFTPGQQFSVFSSKSNSAKMITMYVRYKCCQSIKTLGGLLKKEQVVITALSTFPKHDDRIWKTLSDIFNFTLQPYMALFKNNPFRAPVHSYIMICLPH